MWCASSAMLKLKTRSSLSLIYFFMPNKCLFDKCLTGLQFGKILFVRRATHPMAEKDNRRRTAPPIIKAGPLPIYSTFPPHSSYTFIFFISQVTRRERTKERKLVLKFSLNWNWESAGAYGFLSEGIHAGWVVSGQSTRVCVFLSSLCASVFVATCACNWCSSSVLCVLYHLLSVWEVPLKCTTP